MRLVWKWRDFQNFQINCPYTCWFPSFPAKVLSGPNTTKKNKTHHQSIRSYWFLNLAPVVCFNPFSSSSGQIFTEWFDLRQGENWKRGGGLQAMLWYQIISNLPYLKYQSIPKHHWNAWIFFCSLKTSASACTVDEAPSFKALSESKSMVDFFPKNAASALIPSRLIDLLPSLHEFNSTTSSQHAGQTCLTRQAVLELGGCHGGLQIYTTCPTNKSQS